MSSEPPTPAEDAVARRQRRSEAAGIDPPRAKDPEGETEFADTELTDAELAEARAARAEARAESAKSPTRNIIEWVGVILGAVIIAVVIRTFVFQTFWIPSPSMATTLVKDDRVLVNKLSYKFHDVNRGDVVVFERPDNMPESDIKDLIKRVVALSGERVSVRNGKVYIDGKELEEPYTDGQPTEPMMGCGAGDTTGIDTPEGLEIPPDHVLVMGDNRTNSDDGRCFGPIDEDLIVGRAFMIMWPPSKIGGL